MDTGTIVGIVAGAIGIFFIGIYVGLCCADHIWHKCLNKVAKEFEEKDQC